MQNTEIENNDYIDSIDLLSKHLSQSKSVINTLVADEHFKTLNSSDLANALVS